ATQAFLQVDNSKTASYTGLAIATLTTSTPNTTAVLQLFAANFKSGAIDVFDAQFKPVTLAAGTFTDPKVPAGYAPFNIWNLGGKLYIAYAQQNAAKTGNSFGAGLGYVSVFDTTGKLLQSLIAGGTGSLLNAPWGLAIAPASFGKFANDLLVGNFGDGTINAYDPATGAVIGTLQDATGKNIVIQGLWSLLLGNGGSGGDKDAIYFTAGPGNEKHGLLGSITANPNVLSTGVTNAAQGVGGIAANTFVTIKGTDLTATKRTWATADFGTSGKALPISLDGVSVTVNGEAAFISYISPVQINVLTPTDLPASGPIAVVITDNTLTSTSINVTPQLIAPTFFLLDTPGHIAAQHANFSLIGTTTSTPAGTPAAPGEVIILYGNGFGATNPAAVNGLIQAGVAPLVKAPTITFNNVNATVAFAGLTATGLYQFNVTVPAGLPDGDATVIANVGGVSSPTGALITIKN
ncbi:MAG TPA: TIGR03118 family protein, partial [Candidatus Solibacter sp.]|nr:TIGR03118 family protein [Candidatus Solibacter sp.]